MSRSAFNISRLIPQLRSQASHEGRDFDSDESKQSSFAKESRKESWFKSRRSRSRKRRPTPIIISRPQSIHNVTSPLPPLPRGTPRSSGSSACSWEKYGDSFRFVAVGRTSPLYSVASRDDRSEVSLQPSSATSYGVNDDFSSYLRKDHIKPPSPLGHKPEPSSPNLDPVEALTLEPENKEHLDDRQLAGENNSTANLSDSVQLLIQETDDAFKAVGKALAEVHIERRSYNETPKLPPLNTNFEALPYSRPVLRKRRPRSQARVVLTSPVASPRRASTTSKVKRRRSQSMQMKPQRRSLVTTQATKNNSRWTLGDNVSELFSGKLFNKIEADEMVTPLQIEDFRRQRLSKLRIPVDTSADTLHTFDAESADTPIEPFHMDDLPSRIGYSGVTLTASTPDEDKAPWYFGDVVKREFSSERPADESVLGEKSRKPYITTSASHEDPAALRNIVSTAQHSIKGAGRYMFRKVPELPTISETACQDDELSLASSTSSIKHNQESVADAEYVFLRSTPHTVVAPNFIHGPIRLAKSDLFPDPKLGADDGLDWTAFQMAILGGAGDFHSDSDYHIIRQQEVDEIEALRDWWDGWNFESCGALVIRDDEPPSPTSTLSGDESGDYLYTEIGRDNPYSPHHKWSHRRRKAVVQSRTTLDLGLADRGYAYGDSGGDKLYNGGEIQKWSANGPGDGCVGREGLISHPQSPMVDVHVVESSDEDVDYVPMGYNLSHDLGDFLAWGAERVYPNVKLYG